MAYYSAKEITDTDGKASGKFHYTCHDGSGIRAIGYCSPWDCCKTCAEKHAYPADPDCPECAGKGIWPKENPCPGHDTPEEAATHYDAYLADNVKWADKKTEWPKEKCDAPDCNNEGRNHAMVPGRWRDGIFCNEHKSREAVFAYLQSK